MFHKEGFRIITITFLFAVAVVISADHYISSLWMSKGIQIVALVFLILVLQFFRNPKRIALESETQIIAPADGKIVIIEEVEEPSRHRPLRPHAVGPASVILVVDELVPHLRIREGGGREMLAAREMWWRV